MTRIAILDADGVFLDERPYWNAALAAALDRSGLACAAADRWDTLADYAFGPVGMQRVAKRRGCNSNWDLAAVLLRGLEDDARLRTVAELLRAGRDFEAMQALSFAADVTWRPRDRRPIEGDPLAGFGIDRTAPEFAATVEAFQRRLHGEGDPPWAFDTVATRGPVDAVRAALGAMRRRGISLRICTGRHRVELERPLRELGLADDFDPAWIVTADDVDLAEARTGRAPLGKPHWFAPACALIGFERALRMVERADPEAVRDAPAAIYIGDGWADFLAVGACRALGLPIGFAHVRSGVTTAEQERHIAGAAATVAVAGELASLAVAGLRETVG